MILLLAFILELIAFFAFAALAFVFELNTIIQIVMYILLLVLVIAFWSRFMSPRASKKLQGQKYYASKAVIYLIAAFVLFNTVNVTVAVLFIVIWLIDELLVYILRPIHKPH